MPDTPNTIDLTRWIPHDYAIPTWHAVLVKIVPALLKHGTRRGQDDALDTLREAARKLEMFQRFVDSDDRVLRMLQDFQQQEAAR